METSVNNKCKAFTSVEQSRKLAEILPVESADMYYACGAMTPDIMTSCKQDYRCYTMCWSLTALLDAIPTTCDDGRHCLSLIDSNPNGETEWLCCYEDCNGNLLNECYAKNPVDACYDMIITLHEKKRLYNYGRYD